LNAVKKIIWFALIFSLGFISSHIWPVLYHPIQAARIVAGAPPPSLPAPVEGVKSSRIRGSWGEPRPGGRIHKGIDIFAQRGRPVLSTTRGVVIDLGRNTLGGNTVRVLGPGGWVHYYAHLDGYGPIKSGDIIEPGAVLGFVGNTGNAKATPPHLHYAIYLPGQGAFNPYPLLVPAP